MNSWFVVLLVSTPQQDQPPEEGNPKVSQTNPQRKTKHSPLTRHKYIITNSSVFTILLFCCYIVVFEVQLLPPFGLPFSFHKPPDGPEVTESMKENDLRSLVKIPTTMGPKPSYKWSFTSFTHSKTL